MSEQTRAQCDGYGLRTAAGERAGVREGVSKDLAVQHVGDE
jgi:hypothetical protein